MSDRIFTGADGRKYINNEPRLGTSRNMSYTIRIETHDAICADLHKKIRELIVENEHLRQSLIRLREQGRETDEQQPRSESGPSSN